MISLNDFKNILPQIQKRLIDYIAAERILSTIDDRKKSKERLPSSDIMALCTELSILIEFYRSLGGFYLNSFYLKCSERFILHRDSLLIYKSEEGVYHAGYLLAYFESLSNTNDHKLIVAPLCVHNNHILSMISPGYNVIDIQTLKKSSVLKQYKVLSNKLLFGEIPKKEYPYIVISISKVVSKALYIETEKFNFICPLLNSFEHN
uniref:Peptidase_C39_2 domain-containing protein n=1 Tax=Strongyloides papillosus TaxID=174720 RepID=A0A0N5BIW6_STREA